MNNPPTASAGFSGLNFRLRAVEFSGLDFRLRAVEFSGLTLTASDRQAYIQPQG